MRSTTQAGKSEHNCLFITMIHHGSIYLGRLNFNHEEFCGQIFEVLKVNYGRSLIEIGSLDIPDALDSL